MTDVQEVLRRWQAGASIRSIASEGIADRKTVTRYIKTAVACGVERSTAIDEEVVQRVSRALSGHLEGRPLSEHWEVLGRARARLKGWLLGPDPMKLTRVQELLVRDGIEVPYTTLRRFARQELGWRKPRTTVRLDDPEPGQEAQIDFGEMGRLETVTGNHRLWVLVVTLSWSRYMFVYPTFDQKLPAVCDGLDAAWRFFGGVVVRVVLDNASAMVVRAHATDPRINPSFLEYANARGFFVDPARVRHPQDKPRVESNVRYIRERWFKGERFGPNIYEIRAHAERWCRDVAGARIHGTTQRVPREEFETAEQSRLLPAPTEPFDVPEWCDAKVHPDHHIQVKKALYSVPHLYTERQAWVRVRIDRQTVRIYFRNEVIKVHPRMKSGERSTDPNDYPTGKAVYATRSIERLVRRAHDKSQIVGSYAERLLEGPLPWTRMRQAYALLRLCDKYGTDRVNEVCRRSLDFDVVDVPRIERMLRAAQRLEDAGDKARKVVRLPPSKFARSQDSFRTVAAVAKPEGEER